MNPIWRSRIIIWLILAAGVGLMFAIPHIMPRRQAEIVIDGQRVR